MATFFQVRSLVDKATKDNKEPTNGFVYNEICKLTNVSDSACLSTLDYLMKRLRHKSPRVRLKTLQVIQKCCEKGHLSFRRDLVLRAEEVRACLQFSAPKDPMEGDAPVRKVKEAAGILLNIMYDTSEREEEPSLRKGKGQRSIEGGQNSEPAKPYSYNNETTSISSSGGGGGNIKKNISMQSMGNWEPPPKDESWLGVIAETATDLYTKARQKAGLDDPNAIDWNDRDIYTRQGNTGGSGYAGASSTSNYGGQQAPTLFNKKKKKNRRAKGGVGGGWADEDEEEESSEVEEEQYQQQQQQQQQEQRAAEPLFHTEAAVQAAAELEGDDSSSSEGDNSTMEYHCVEEIAHHGLRSVPTEQELSEFVNKAKQLNGKVLAAALHEKMAVPDSQTRLKALHALQACLDNKVKHVRSFTKKHGLPLVNLTVDSGAKRVQALAAKLVQRLWSKGGAPSPQGAVPSIMAAKTSASLFDDVPSSHVAAETQNTKQQPNLLFGLQPNPAPQPATQNLLFGPAPVVSTAPVVQQKPVPSGGSGDLASLLSGINLNAPNLQRGTTMVSSPPPQYQQPQQPIFYTQPIVSSANSAPKADPFGTLWAETAKK